MSLEITMGDELKKEDNFSELNNKSNKNEYNPSEDIITILSFHGPDRNTYLSDNDIERDVIAAYKRILNYTEGNISGASRMIGISRSTASNAIHEFGIDPQDHKPQINIYKLHKVNLQPKKK